MSEPQRLRDGEFAGWLAWNTDPYETINGPFVFREEADGETLCALRIARRHLNGHGAAHGGLLMTFADFALFAIARRHLGPMGGVTVSCTSQFLGPAHEGDLLLARGRVARAGKGLIFVEVGMTSDDRPVLSVSGIIKNLRPRPA